MNNPFLSIIVPVYNVEQYIRKCIDSILAQTFADFELILVDDGSTDNSGKICDEYLLKDTRIKVLHQKNSGVTKARSNGVDIANGEYIAFVDSDDFIPKDAIETLCSCIESDIDIIIGKVFESELFPLNNNVKNERVIIDINKYRIMQLSQLIPTQSGPFAKLFRKSLFNNFVFSIPREIVMGEDWLMNIRLSFNAIGSICFINHVVYNYTIKPSSVTNNFKTTLSYESHFYKLYMESIPYNLLNDFLKITIDKRLNVYMNITGYLYKIPEGGDIFYSRLLNDIKVVNYKMSYSSKLLFYIKKPLLRFFIIFTKKVFNKIKKMIQS